MVEKPEDEAAVIRQRDYQEQIEEYSMDGLATSQNFS